MLNLEILKFISEDHLDDLQNSKLPSIYIIGEGYSILTLRLLKLTLW